MTLKHCFSSVGIAACCLLSAACQLSAEPMAKLNPDNPASAEFLANAKANRTKIEALAKDAKLNTDVFYFAVPAMSEVMRLGDVYPIDGHFNSELITFAAQGEYEPVSFQLFSLNNKKNVTFKISDLKNADGKILPAKNLDLKVVKIWYQNGNRWISYFDDFGLRLCPELLLKDENMVKVDTKEVANYARIKNGNKEKFVWISAPRKLDSKFNAMQKGFEDAKEMQSVTLNANEFKQFFVTVGVPEKQAPGCYNGTITVNADGKNVSTIPVKLTVLPFALPYPETYKKPGMPIVCSVMGGFGIQKTRSEYKDEKIAMQKYTELLENIKAHSLFHPSIDSTEENINIIKKMGFPTNVQFGNPMVPWFAHNFGGRMTFDQMMTAKDAARKCSEFYKKMYGHNNILVSYGDEQGGAFVVAQRDFFKYYEEYGIRMGCAGHASLFQKGAHVYGNMPIGSDPDDKHLAPKWNDMRDAYYGFYACQHTASENPAFIRRQNGFLGYFNGMNLINNYEFAIGPWNDITSDVYRPMVVAYKNYGGIVDTLQWEGYREAIDDLRYATLLQQEIDKGLKCDDQKHRIAAKIALRYLALLEPDKMDLDGVRAEMVLHILNLRSFSR